MIFSPALLRVFVLIAFVTSSAAISSAAMLPAQADSEPVDSEPVDYETQIKPLLAVKCLDCHGPDAQESHLRVDRKWSLLRGGDSGEPAIIELRAAESHLVQLIAGKDPSGKSMPPDEADRLTSEEVDLISRWIDEGAVWPGESGQREVPKSEITHWSFTPVVRPPVPQIDSPWAANPIDAFVLESLTKRGLSPSAKAERQRRVRRLYLDVLGLPPTPEQMTEALSVPDTQEHWQHLVDEVLASPHYGERWARYWLDLVRFAETTGFETNRERPNAWPYRDYVIESLNADKPYNLFLQEQLAGDVLGVPEATGYLVAGSYDIVKSPDINLTLMQRQNELDDMISTTGSVFLGLTVGCARCHNHKFDPVAQTDYYSLQAVFAGVRHADRQLPETPQRAAELASLRKEAAVLESALRPLVKGPSYPRPALNTRMNEESFNPVEARFARFTINKTNASEPCIDELEVYCGEKNVGLATSGTIATSSGDLPGYAIHQLKHLNDGLHGNSHSWISSENGKGWVQLEWRELALVDRIRWGRDRDGAFADRLAVEYIIELSSDGQTWTQVASHEDRPPFGQESRPPEYDFGQLNAESRATAEAQLDRLRTLQKKIGDLEASRVVYAGTFEQPGPTHRLFRGDPLAQREVVAPDTIALLGELGLSPDAPEQSRRAAFAAWVAADENPLTGRVIANRVWQFHFGKGLVVTPGDFGLAGVPPTHPELLNWMAAELREHGWSLKHLHRLILTSQTWQQDSRPRTEALAADGGTQFLWRFPPRRLEAEPIRDSILSVSGVIDLSQGGPGYSAFEVDLENVRHYFPLKTYGPAQWRRMIYMTKVRQEQDSVFGIFDCPDASTSVAARSRSTTPLQALNLFNSDFILQQSELFAKRLQQEHPADLPGQVRRAWELAYCRPAAEDEVADSVHFIETEGLAAFCRALFNSNEFLFIE